jgi:hypothetical protein
MSYGMVARLAGSDDSPSMVVYLTIFKETPIIFALQRSKCQKYNALVMVVVSAFEKEVYKKLTEWYLCMYIAHIVSSNPAVF